MVLIEKSKDNQQNNDGDFGLWKLLNHAERVVARSRELELAQYGLTREQASVLDELMMSGGSATNADLTDATMRQHHSVTSLVNRMAERGLVRKKKTSSKNKYLVSITEQGRIIYGQITRNSIEMAFSEFPAEDKLKLAEYLNKLVIKGRKMLGFDYKPPFLTSSH
jgi:DNA-binding MarR family transcriptional regulator